MASLMVHSCRSNTCKTQYKHGVETMPRPHRCCTHVAQMRVKHNANIELRQCLGLTDGTLKSLVETIPRPHRIGPGNLGPIRPKTLLGPLGHPGPSADLLPDLLPLVGQEAQMFSGIWALPTIPPPQALRDMCLDVSKCTASSAPQLCQGNIP